VYLISCWAVYGECNNATGRSAHRLGLAVALESTI
jgi:hypothetical protein